MKLKRTVPFIIILAILIQNAVYANSKVAISTNTKSKNSSTLKYEQVKSNLSYSLSKNTAETDRNSFLYANIDNTYTMVTSLEDAIYIQALDKNLKPLNFHKYNLACTDLVGYHNNGKYQYIVTRNSVKDNTNSNSKVRVPNNDRLTFSKYSLYGEKISSHTILAKSIKEKTHLKYEDKISWKNLKIIPNFFSSNSSIALAEANNIYSSIYFFNTDNMEFRLEKFIKLDNFGERISSSLIDDINVETLFSIIDDNNTIILCSKKPNGIFIKGDNLNNETNNNFEAISLLPVYIPQGTILEENNSFTLEDFDMSDNYYIAAGTAVTQDENYDKNTDYNLFISALNINQTQPDLVETKFVTNYTKADNITIDKGYIIRANDNKFVLIWQETKDKKATVKYTIIDSKNNIGKIKEMKNALLSNCRPVYNNGKISWFTIKNDGANANFYSIAIK